MRLLNMNELRFLKSSILRGLYCIGNGTFASVFARDPAAPTVTKVTTDRIAYCLLADQNWHVMSESVAKSFPKLIEDHGDVGESRGATVYVVEVERLHPVSTKENRRFIREWSRAWSGFEHDMKTDCLRFSNSLDKYQVRSARFCQAQAKIEGPFQAVFQALGEFILNYGGSLDLKQNNFMERPSTGELVFNDVLCDYVDLLKRSHVN